MPVDRLGIMQPYFFPYLGYFDLINLADRWIVFDTVQYIRKGWMNRNRIHHPNRRDDLLIRVPIRKAPRATPIKDIRIADDPAWRGRLLAQIDHYRGSCPHYEETHAFVERCLAHEETSLSRFNVALLAEVCAHLGLDFRYDYFSELDLGLGPVDDPGEWALRICEALGAREYVNPPGGRAIFDPRKFAARGIELTIRDVEPIVYPCWNYPYIPRLSVIAVMMFVEPRQMRAYLDRQRPDASGG